MSADKPQPVRPHASGNGGKWVEPSEWQFDDDLDDTCWNCGGEGFVADCFEEYACIDPESGCDLCTRRCGVCRPQPKRVQP